MWSVPQFLSKVSLLSFFEGLLFYYSSFLSEGFRTLANAGLSICMMGKVKEAAKPKPGEELPTAGAEAAMMMKAKEDSAACRVM
jgi:hypothetical protein